MHKRAELKGKIKWGHLSLYGRPPHKKVPTVHCKTTQRFHFQEALKRGILKPPQQLGRVLTPPYTIYPVALLRRLLRSNNVLMFVYLRKDT